MWNLSKSPQIIWVCSPETRKQYGYVLCCLWVNWIIDVQWPVTDRLWNDWSLIRISHHLHSNLWTKEQVASSYSCNYSQSCTMVTRIWIMSLAWLLILTCGNWNACILMRANQRLPVCVFFHDFLHFKLILHTWTRNYFPEMSHRHLHPELCTQFLSGLSSSTLTCTPEHPEHQHPYLTHSMMGRSEVGKSSGFESIRFPAGIIRI